jgi:hypothetical protein
LHTQGVLMVSSDRNWICLRLQTWLLAWTPRCSKGSWYGDGSAYIVRVVDEIASHCCSCAVQIFLLDANCTKKFMQVTSLNLSLPVYESDSVCAFNSSSNALS